MHRLFISTCFEPAAKQISRKAPTQNTQINILMHKIELKFPVLVHRLDGPVELLTQGLGEELLDGDVELLREDHGETGIDVVLK